MIYSRTSLIIAQTGSPSWRVKIVRTGVMNHARTNNFILVPPEGCGPIFFSQSTDGGVTFAPNVKVTTAMSDESAANPFAQAHDQYGDYEGIVAFDGSIHPIWTDGRFDATIDPATGLRLGEEIFTATITV